MRFTPPCIQPAPFALAITLTLAASGVCIAQTAASASQAVTLSIASQPLGSALNELSAATGTPIGFSPALVQGKMAHAVNGNLTTQQAIDQLLTGSGLIAAQQAGGIVIKAAELSDEVITLDAVMVTRQRQADSATEGTGSYTTESMNTATKLPLSIRETPQAVTVITRQQLNDRGVETLENALSSTPGISQTKDGPNRVAFYSRGFVVDSLTTDGLPAELSHYISREMNSSPDMAIYDRVEVVRGATGLTTGAGNPSASINLVRKRPTATPQLSLTSSVGSWDNYRAELDASNALNQAGTLRGRAVATYQKKNSFQDVANAERSVLYAIAEADLSSHTLLTAGVSHQKLNTTASWGGLPTALDGGDLGFSRSTYLGNTWDYWNQDNTTLFSKLEHRFDNDWKVQLAASRTWSKMDMLGSQLERTYLEGASQWGQYVGQYVYKDQQDSYDLYATGPFQLFGRSHEFVTGASLRDLDFRGNGNARSDELDMDLHNWNSSGNPPQAMDMDFWRQTRTTKQKSIYATTRLNPSDSLKFILGGRLDWYDHDALTINGRRSSSSAYSVNKQVTSYAGVVYDIDKQHSVYASYTDIFKPQSELDATGSPLKPIVGKNVEVGIKGEYFDGELNASAAVFRIDQQNRAKALSRNQCSDLAPTCSEAAGEIRSQGVELEINGRLAPGWQLAAGYTYSQAKYRKDADASKEGTPFSTDLPRQGFKLFTTYQLPGELHRWTLGGGIRWQSQIYNAGVDSDTPYRIEQKAYAVADLLLAYRASERLDLRLNIDNLFDKRYWAAIGANTSYAVNQYGEPRKFMLTASYKF